MKCKTFCWAADNEYVFDWFFELESCYRLLQNCAQAAGSNSSPSSSFSEADVNGAVAAKQQQGLHIQYITFLFFVYLLSYRFISIYVQRAWLVGRCEWFHNVCGGNVSSRLWNIAKRQTRTPRSQYFGQFEWFLRSISERQLLVQSEEVYRLLLLYYPIRFWIVIALVFCMGGQIPWPPQRQGRGIYSMDKCPRKGLPCDRVHSRDQGDTKRFLLGSVHFSFAAVSPGQHSAIAEIREPCCDTVHFSPIRGCSQLRHFFHRRASPSNIP